MGVLGFALWLGCFASEERGPVVADAPSPEVPVDADGDGVEAPADCDDADAGVLPGMVEACDGVVPLVGEAGAYAMCRLHRNGGGEAARSGSSTCNPR
jgi:hypothetical protein